MLIDLSKPLAIDVPSSAQGSAVKEPAHRRGLCRSARGARAFDHSVSCCVNTSRFTKIAVVTAVTLVDPLEAEVRVIRAPSQRSSRAPAPPQAGGYVL